MSKAADNPRKAIVILNARPPKDILPKATYKAEGCRFNSCLTNREASNLIGAYKEELGLTRTTAQILQKLLEHQNPDTGICNPTQETLAQECCVCLSTVEKGIKQLKAASGEHFHVVKYQFTPMKSRCQHNFSIDSIIVSKIPNDLATRKGYGQKYKYQRILLRVFLKEEELIKNIDPTDRSEFKNPLGEKELNKRKELSECYEEIEKDVIPHLKKEQEKEQLAHNIAKLKELTEERKQWEEDQPESIDNTRSYVSPTFDTDVPSNDDDYPDDILEWAATKTDEELRNDKLFRSKQWAAIRVRENLPSFQQLTERAERITKSKTRDQVSENVKHEPRYFDPSRIDRPVTKEQLRHQRINEIPTRYPNYEEVLEREGCDLETLQYRMRENEQYEPFTRDTSKFDSNCHPEYGFMGEDERDKDFIGAVDHWFGVPNRWFYHTDRNRKMFQKARIRADAIGANYVDWVKAMYEHWGPMNIMYTHINNKWGEEIYKRWVKKGKPYPVNLGSIKMQHYYRNKFDNDKKRPFTNYKARREIEDALLEKRLEKAFEGKGL